MDAVRGVIARMRGFDGATVDAIIGGLLAVAAIAIELASKHHTVGGLLSGAVISLTVVWRRRAPAVTTLIAVAGIAVYQITEGDPHSAVEPFAVLLNYYMLGRRSAERDRVWVEGLLLAAAIGAIVASPGTSKVIDILTSWMLFIGLPFAAGRAVGSRSALTRELRADAERLEREQEERTRHAAAEERTRIARELHDVVAHSVSVMVIQTAAARRVAAADREAAREALRAVEDCGRDALVEMRRMVGVLRRGDAALSGVASPGISHLGELAARARSSGLPVELQIEGEPADLPPGLDLVAFRVVQEALTNAIKHAGPARAVVRVRFSEQALELEVSDNGRGPQPLRQPSERVGHGLVGMRERLTLYGGELVTGRRRGGGFQVKARIPLEQAVPA